LETRQKKGLSQTVPQDITRIVIHRDGRIILRMMLLGTSKSAYGKKKTVRMRLYCVPVRFNSAFIPATLAFATFERSIKDKM
jgi:hypothetical protein